MRVIGRRGAMAAQPALVLFFPSLDELELLLLFFFFVSRAAKMFPLVTEGCPLLSRKRDVHIVSITRVQPAWQNSNIFPELQKRGPDAPAILPKA